MFKTFLVGILLGAAAAAGALYALPVVDQQRERSIISVAPNGGNAEIFHIKIPMDRVMVGGGQQSTPLPVGLEWPTGPAVAGVQAELFKVRNVRDTVVGVASRVAATGDDTGTIEWLIHLPARGSMHVAVDPAAQEGGYRVGQLRVGTREFTSLTGTVSERWLADSSGEDGAPTGHIELKTAFVGEQEQFE